ncbi:MAG: aminoglycoside phosphotransferase family protein [Planctomycetes bacterium]|nr:aminoglycoside phosphotransferase family protein [Planctomycetota bacterium]
MQSEPPVPALMARRFQNVDDVVLVEPFRAGHINDSYRVEAGTPAGTRVFLLQRINTAIFTRPVELMENIQRSTAHIAARLRAARAPDADRKCLRVIPARTGDPAYRAPNGSWWRMYAFIENSRCRLAADSAALVEFAGAAFGEFLSLLSDLPPPRLHEVIPGFHDTRQRLAALETAVSRNVAGRAGAVADEIRFLRSRSRLAGALADLRQRGAVSERVAHNDAKISNVLVDAQTGEALCVVDLDTLMPGLVLSDFGDMVRSMTCMAAEDEPDASRVKLRLDFFESLARGFLRTTRDLLSPAERVHLVDGGQVITYEQAVRFLTDYLNGDTYYRTTRPDQNLDRTRTQIRLLEELLSHEQELRRIVECAH